LGLLSRANKEPKRKKKTGKSLRVFIFMIKSKCKLTEKKILIRFGMFYTKKY